jgi:hypothetical protein
MSVALDIDDEDMDRFFIGSIFGEVTDPDNLTLEEADMILGDGARILEFGVRRGGVNYDNF